MNKLRKRMWSPLLSSPSSSINKPTNNRAPQTIALSTQDRSMAAAVAKVCVVGGGGYIGSWLVKKLLERGCTVHATVRGAGDEKKTGPLRSLPGAGERLVLFEADVYDPAAFEPAIAGCRFVFLVATPLQHNPGDGKFKDTTEAAVEAARAATVQCQRAGTVRRLIYTGTICAASTLRVDGSTSSYADFIDESCWSTPGFPYLHTNQFLTDYVSSKTLSEQLLLSCNGGEDGGVEVVTLAVGLVGSRDTSILTTPDSIAAMVAPLTGKDEDSNFLRFLQALLGSNPIVHLEDACEAHVFCMERESMAGRYLCAAAYPTMEDVVDFFARKYPQYKITEQVEGKGVRVQPRADKLPELGFKYKYGMEEILEHSVECAKRFGFLP